MGLYLLTPVLRVILAYAKRSLLKYSLLLWLAGTTNVPALTILAGYNVTGNVFLITGWLGYFVLGAYIVGIHWSSAQPSTSEAQHLGTEQQATVAI